MQHAIQVRTFIIAIVVIGEIEDKVHINCKTFHLTVHIKSET